MFVLSFYVLLFFLLNPCSFRVPVSLENSLFFQFLYSNERMISNLVQKNVADGFVTGVVAGLAAVGIRCSLVF